MILWLLFVSSVTSKSIEGYEKCMDDYLSQPVVVDYPVVYKCDRGMCLSSNTSTNPDYEYHLYVDDRSLKVKASAVAVTAHTTHPVFTCVLDGWLTVTDVSFVCKSPTYNGQFYCTGNDDFAICVPEE